MESPFPENTANVDANGDGTHPPTRRQQSLLAITAGGALVGASALIHLHLWASGYRHIPVIGPMFLVQGAVGLAIAVAVIILRRPVFALIAAGFLLSTIAGLLTSIWWGIFGFHDSFGAPFALASLIVEITGVVLLVIALLFNSPKTIGPNRIAFSRRARDAP